MPVAIDPHSFPNDPAALRQMVMGLLEAVETERRLRQLQHWVEQLLRARYGPRRERVNENQLFLFAALVMPVARSLRPRLGGTEELPRGRRQGEGGHGRGALPKSLQRQRVVYDLAEGERQCPQCQGDLKRLGEEVSERLEYVPASLVVIQEVCQKYACAKGCTVVTAEKPMAPIEKGLPGAGVAGAGGSEQVWGSLPLHRQEDDLPAAGRGVATPDDGRLDARLR